MVFRFSMERYCSFYLFYYTVSFTIFFLFPDFSSIYFLTNLSFFEQSSFLGWAVTSICNRQSIHPSVAHQISETIHYLIVIFGTHAIYNYSMLMNCKSIFEFVSSFSKILYQFFSYNFVCIFQ